MTQHTWHPEDIKAAIRKQGVTMRRLAEMNGFHFTYMSHALSRPCPAAQRTIANFLGVSRHALWPDFYDENDNRLPSNKQDTIVNKMNRRQMSKAA